MNRTYDYMGQWFDFALTPLYFILLISIGYLLRNKYTRQKPEIKKYFIPALAIRMVGAIIAIFFNDYYIGGNDMAGYYNGSIAYWNVFWDNPPLFFEMLISNPKSFSPEIIQYFVETKTTYYLNSDANLLVMKIGAILNLITFKSIFGNSLIMAFAAFMGCWKMFEFFYRLYPQLHKPIAYATLFIPSMFFWGAAGLVKEPILVWSMGYFMWAFQNIFTLRKWKFSNLFFLVVSFYGMFIIKSYVAIALTPCLMLWLILKNINRIKNRIVRNLAKPVLFSIAIPISIGAVLVLSAGHSRYDVKNIMAYAKGVQNYSVYQTKKSGGVGYDFGDFDLTVSGVIPIIPKAINVSLFRPYIWEAKKVVLLPTIMESIFTFLCTLIVFIKVGILKTIIKILKNPDLILCFGFALTFAFAVGFTTYNFGTLVRYKIPLLPFYFVGLGILYYNKRLRGT